MEFVGNDYKEISASGERASFCLDCYQNFGWLPDERTQETRGAIVLRRERKIVNKVELTRLQRHFEACMDEITALEKSKTTNAAAAALCVWVVGTAFMAGATFAAVHVPPLWIDNYSGSPWISGLDTAPVRLQENRVPPVQGCGRAD